MSRSDYEIEYPFLCDSCEKVEMGKVLVMVDAKVSLTLVAANISHEFEAPDGWITDIACSHECTGLEPDEDCGLCTKCTGVES